MKFLLSIFLLLCLIFAGSNISSAAAQNNSLSTKQQSIVPIASSMATGDIANLKIAVNNGLDNGLTVNETKEVIVHLYAYCGFPRALNGLTAVNEVLAERQAKGIEDVVGKEAALIPAGTDMLQKGTDVQTQVSGRKVDLTALSPAIDEYLKTHLFGDLFARDVLTFQEREIATISALASMNGTESQFQSHLNCGLNVGLTGQQLQSIVNTLEKVNPQIADKAQPILDNVLAARK